MDRISQDRQDVEMCLPDVDLTGMIIDCAYAQGSESKSDPVNPIDPVY
jgi:hypothetical protein